MSGSGHDLDFLRVVALVNQYFPTPRFDSQDPLADIEFVISYIRLSRQDDRSLSPKTQPLRIRETCKQKGWTIIAEFDDATNPISGKGFAPRPAWAELETYVQALPDSKRRKTCILVKSFDRFSRNLEEGLATERRFREELHVRLRSVDSLYTAPETDNGWMDFCHQLLAAEWYRRDIVKKTIDGLRVAKRLGRHLGHMPKFFSKKCACGTLFKGKKCPSCRASGRNLAWVIVPDVQAAEVAALRAEGYSYEQAGKGAGVTRQQAYDVCEFLSREKERLLVEEAE